MTTTLSPELREDIQTVIEENPVVVFMKGTREAPSCGFSAKVTQMLTDVGLDFLDVDVLEDEELREGMKEFSEWPTYPQVYIAGEFLGGADILTEMFESGELKEIADAVNEALAAMDEDDDMYDEDDFADEEDGEEGDEEEADEAKGDCGGHCSCGHKTH